MNGNEDEQDIEEIEIEENPLDESELIQDYKIESLQLYDSGKSNLAQSHVKISAFPEGQYFDPNYYHNSNEKSGNLHFARYLPPKC